MAAAAPLVGTWASDTDTIDVTIPVSSTPGAGLDFTGYSAGVLVYAARMGTTVPTLPTSISGGFPTWTKLSGVLASGTVAGEIVWVGTGGYLGTAIVLDYPDTNRLANIAHGYGLTDIDAAAIRVGAEVTGTGTSLTVNAPTSPASSSILLATGISNGANAGTAESGWTSTANATVTPQVRMMTATRAASAGDTTFLWSGLSSSGRAGVMLELPEQVAATTGTIAVTEADDVTAGAGGSTVTGTSETTEADDTFASTGTTTTAGTVAVTEQDDATTGSGGSTVTGTSSVTEDDDQAAATGTATVTGTSATSDEDDVTSGTGTVTADGTSAVIEADDVFTATGGGDAPEGSAAIVEEDDTAAAAGTVTAAGTLVYTEQDDTSAGAGTTEVTGTAVVTEADDLATAVGGSAVDGTLDTAEGDDTLDAAGTVTAAGPAVWTDEDDTLAATSPAGPVDGTGAWADEDDVLRGVESTTGTATSTARLADTAVAQVRLADTATATVSVADTATATRRTVP